MLPLVVIIVAWESGRNGTGSPNLGGGGTGLLAFAGRGAGGGILGRGGAEDAVARAAPLHANMPPLKVYHESCAADVDQPGTPRSVDLML